MDITDINNKASEYNGYTREELIGKPMSILNSGYYSKNDWKQFWMDIESGKTWQGEMRNKRKDGSFYWLYATVIPILSVDNKVESYLTIRFDITEEKLAKANTVKEVVEAQEHERERFAMEIHDGLGQVLLATKMNLNSLLDDTEDMNADSKSVLMKSNSLLTEAIQEARNISHGLMSRVLNRFGLSHAINEIVTNINSTSQLEFEFNHNIHKLRFEEDIEMGIYRTLQELIKNIINHSKANKASLSIFKNKNTINIKIKDNGIGIKQGVINNPRSGGIGLKNMKSRVEYLGGTFEIKQKVKKGTKINIKLSL